MTKIIFLDIDGVLNSMPNRKVIDEWKKTNKEFHRKLYGIDPDLVKYLKLILDRTCAKIVFSTSWRYFRDHPVEGFDWRKSLADHLEVSTDIFIGNIPDLSECDDWRNGNYTRRRGNEIKCWFDKHTDIIKSENFKFCIIDDEVSDIIPVFGESHVVHVDCKTGIQMKDVDRVVRILNDE